MCKDPHERLVKHMVRTDGDATNLLPCANPHTCGMKISKADVPAKQFFVLHFATKSFAEFSGKPATKASLGHHRNHSFEFFAKNSCRWSMGKETRSALIRSGSKGFTQCGNEDTITCLRRDLFYTQPTVAMPGTVKRFGQVLQSCLSHGGALLEYMLTPKRRCPSISFHCGRDERIHCSRGPPP